MRLLLAGSLVQLLLHLLGLLHEVVVGGLDLGGQLLVGVLQVGGNFLCELLGLLQNRKNNALERANTSFGSSKLAHS